MTREEALKVAKPILFNTEMVRAIQGGTKTVTRRIAFPNKDLHEFRSSSYPEGWWYRGNVAKSWSSILHHIKLANPCKYEVGDILYVRETWCKGKFRGEEEQYYYRADNKIPHCEWHPSIHMPKEAARIFLRVKKISVERLQDSFFKRGSTIFALLMEGVDIGEQCRECIDTYGNPCCIDNKSECGTLDEVRSDYSDLWNSTVKKSDLDKYGWAANPWVRVIEFERIEME